MDEFFSKFLEENKIDIKNFKNIVDFFIASDELERDGITSIFEKEEKIKAKLFGNFTLKLNDKFLIITKSKLSFFPSLYKNIFLLNKNIILKTCSDDFLQALLSLTNFMLLFAKDNPSIYNLKKKILYDLSGRGGVPSSLVTSEYFFISLYNRNYRKSAMSWEYRIILTTKFGSALILEDISKENLNKLNKNLLYSIIKKNDLCPSALVQTDIDNLNSVNEKESRNYHMWCYIIKLFLSRESNSDRLYIILYGIYLLGKCPWDYSSYSFLVNHFEKCEVSKSEREAMCRFLEKSEEVNRRNEHKSYISELVKMINKC